MLRQCSSSSTSVSGKRDEVIKATRSGLVISSPRHLELQYDKSMDMKAEALSEDFDAEYVDQIGPVYPKTFNFAAYANRHKTLQKLVDLGVNLAKLEADRDIANYLVNLDFNRDCKNHIIWLHDQGIKADKLGDFISGYPAIFSENIENLSTRVKYLRIKNFSKEAIVAILTEYPKFISIPVQSVDARLGFLKREFAMVANEIRSLVTRFPKVVTYHEMHIRVRTFAFVEEMGFTKEEFKNLVLHQPKLVAHSQERLVARFDYLHNVVGLSNQEVSRFPALLANGIEILKQRAGYLKILQRDQFNPEKPGYIPPLALCSGSDAEFCERYSKTSVADFNLYLKSL
ncbi:Transcription termination factor 3, mitochondrial [Halotydeus destructor]|nr:Transcription termination factor 3, mitochondrial [Halotydeus destructor]